MPTVLVVDDDPDIRDVIHVYLRNEGYQVIEAADGVAALDILRSERIHLMILDVMMPRMDGILTCMKIREASGIPIIMLSAKDADIDKITGLTSGADDYMIKPFNPLELLARVKAQFRRLSLSHSALNSDEVIQVQDLTIDRVQHQVIVRGQVVSLTPIEFSILELLASHRGQVFNVDRIYTLVWKEVTGFSDNTVMVHIRNLREKIEVNPRSPVYIKTVWGVGYKIDQ
ncbi:response regulator transcription factor [Paenibacillus terrigena]|uniref:response regulator transcription factor n=1 Tax=Paenibacillus terrigena TaxID=369333 RepID=UPI0003726A78|nr:response regulator transcription factor [Paenibacillus terrigena]